MFTISWNEHEEHSDSLDEVEDLLDRLHETFASGDPTVVTVEHDVSGDSLSIGLGRELSVLNFVRGDLNPPYYTSTGGTLVDEPISFFFGGEWSEYPLKHAIPISAARAAITEFCETGSLTKSVVWEE